MQDLRNALLRILPENRIRTRLIDRISFASDAGFYHLVPKAVVQPSAESEIQALFALSQQEKIPLVFRGGGTSLSGQSITDGILVDLSQHWNRMSVEENGKFVRVQPGVIGSQVNARLKPWKRKIGPDPSSISAAMMGGILSNNSSGMCCGVAQNSYHTTRTIRFILPDGSTFDTGEASHYKRFEQEKPGLANELTQIRNQIQNNPQLHEMIREKYQMKNTVGYALNALIDFEHPLDILAHLLIGGEGTLAFIAEATLETVPEYPCKSTGLLFFETVSQACDCIPALNESGARMVELMDRASLRAVENMEGIPSQVALLPEGAAALLVEFQEDSESDLQKNVGRFQEATLQMPGMTATPFTRDPGQQALLWKVRKGLFPAVGAVRKSGTTVILEDIAFPVARLGQAIEALQDLFKEFAYENAIIFGHARDGNIHFVVTQSFSEPSETDRYDRFMRKVVDLVVHQFQGTLKAEHGTGRNMAPFVETEWGPEAYAIMQRIKNSVDPNNLLNPGVILNDNPHVHIENLKALPTVEPEVDKCIECGYCEPRCPSRDLSASPRRRIVIRRALALLKAAGNQGDYEEILKDQDHESLETCAVDGLCAGACPVDINTGELVKRLRRENHSDFANHLALLAARHFNTVEKGMQMGLQAGHFTNQILGKTAMTRITTLLRKGIPGMPLWAEGMPKPARFPKQNSTSDQAQNGTPGIIYFPACISRMMGTYPGKERNLMETFLRICEKTGIPVHIPDSMEGTCCSQIFSSKGYSSAYAWMANQTFEKMWKASLEGAIPVVIDVSSCAYTLRNIKPVLNPENQDHFARIKFLDSVEFLYSEVLPRAIGVKKKGKILLHPVCSLEKMKTSGAFEAIARKFAEEVIVPLEAGCCGMAGDRGFFFPELTASATRSEAREAKDEIVDGCYSSTRTCELAMSQAVQKNYESILYLVEEGLPEKAG